ncbi:transglutaminase TgpA family protein [Butyrivibrio sp. VCD2006]|uniref:transglutaminase TgpA family protein n=1 Tax=Butyrivibrio sp. VCD2006 TaxID=1280664 RepID=UPI00041746EF|nr:transglutaminase domain-containing protein [Butyrivibrio sp. VCD2006]
MIVEILYDLLFIMPFSLGVSSFVYGYIEPVEIEFKYTWIVITVLTTAFLLLMKHLKLKGRAVLAGILLAFLLGLWLLIPSKERLDLIKENIWILREIALSVVSFAVGMVSGKYRKLRIVEVLGGIALLVVLLIRNVEVGKISVCMIMIFALLIAIDEIQRLSTKEGDTEPKKHLVAVSPFIIVGFVLIGYIEVPEKPYDWRIARSISEFVVSEYIMLSENVFGQNGWDSGSPLIGFSNRGEIGGDLAKSERTVMRLESRSENDPRLYLSGKSFDSFDGHSWTKKDDNKADERLMDTLETMSFVLDENGDAPVTDILKRVALTVQYKDMHTQCLFLPEKYLPVGKAWDKKKIEGGDVLFPNKRSARDPYDVVFYRINKDSASFNALVRNAHEVTEDSFEAAKVECEIKSDVSYSDYLTYRDAVYKYYLPEVSISAELKTRMDALMDGADSNYEKLRRLEGVFLDFKYTNSPGALPDTIADESDFLDYFILEKKEGYCSYFATAFVLLARKYGIPARYVQGFCVPMGRYGKYEVSSSLAHAWAEAYIEGVGWINFEPTPGMRKDVVWAIDAEKEDIAEVVEDEYAAYRASLTEGEVENQLEEEEQPQVIVIDWYKVVIPVAAGVTFTLLLFAIDRLLKRRKYLKLSERGKAAVLCKNSMELLRRKHLGRRAEETLSEYSERLREDLTEEQVSFIRTYEEILYSERDISEDERKLMEERFAGLRKFFQGRAVRQFWDRYVTG